MNINELIFSVSIRDATIDDILSLPVKPKWVYGFTDIQTKLYGGRPYKLPQKYITLDKANHLNDLGIGIAICFSNYLGELKHLEEENVIRILDTYYHTLNQIIISRKELLPILKSRYPLYSYKLSSVSRSLTWPEVLESLNLDFDFVSIPPYFLDELTEEMIINIPQEMKDKMEFFALTNCFRYCRGFQCFNKNDRMNMGLSLEETKKDFCFAERVGWKPNNSNTFTTMPWGRDKIRSAPVRKLYNWGFRHFKVIPLPKAGLEFFTLFKERLEENERINRISKN